MKKIISFALVLALCLALFAGCQPQTNEPAESGLEKAKQYLNNYFQGTDAKTATDYQVPGIILIDGVTYTVEWTTDVEAIVVTRLENNMVQIDLPELAAEKVDYVLTATVSDANGDTIQYSVNREIPKSDSVGKNDEQIVEEAYTLPSYNSYDKTSGQYKDKDGNVIEGTVIMEGVTVTGVVKSIRIPYDAGYNNITVIIQVGNLADKPIDCYRLTGDGIADLAPGDTVTVQGTLANYQGTVQFAAASVAMSIEKGPEVTCPATPAEILTAAKALAEGWALPYKSTMTGVVTEITSAYAANYMNLTCNIEVDGNKIICYRLLGELGANLKVGDTITVTGYLMNYKGDLEYGQGCTLDSLVPGEGGSTEEPTEPTPVTKIEYVDAPAVNTAYKLVMNQAGLGKHLGVTGAMNGYYWATSESFDEMVDVYLEAVENSYRIYFTVDGVKTYMNIIPRDNDATKTNVVFQTLEANANPTAYILNTEHKFIYATGVTSDDWYLGTYGTNVTVGASKTSYIDDKSTIGVSQFVAWFAVAGTSSEEPGTEPSEPTEPEVTEPTTPAPSVTLENGSKIVIVCGAYNKALSSQPASSGSFYQLGVDVVIANGAVTGYADTEVWTVIAHADGTYSFAQGGQNLGMQASYSSMSLGAVNDKWELIPADNGTFVIKNVVRGNCIEWYASKNNWSTYTTSSLSDPLFNMSIFFVEGGSAQPPVTEPEVTEPEVTEPEATQPSTDGAKGSADFGTFDVTHTSGGDSSYTNAHTTANGWTTANSAIQAGGVSDANPVFKVFGPDNTYKAVCLNGKVSAPGKLTSPTLTGGINKLTFNYTKCFSDTQLGVIVTITDLATGTTYEKTLEASPANKFDVGEFVWELDTAISGDFTIVIVNSCPSANTGNKDRISIWNLNWY